MNSKAIILLGHSNSGKSPLGDLIAMNLSRKERRFLHFDFGYHLRSIAAQEIKVDLSGPDIAFVRSILNGTLLDDAHFYIAEAILHWFAQSHGLQQERDVFVLNGLPRHQGQARDLLDMGVHPMALAYLSCTPEDALARKRLADNGEGHEDRSNRNDHDPEIFKKRVESFNTRTLPLLDFYTKQTVPIFDIPILAHTTPEAAFRILGPQLQNLGI